MKNRTRTGKIARLPRQIREELNRRLQDGEPGTQLVEWLNSLPQVQRVMAADFEGEPVSEPNLSRWRQGGYQDWLEQQEALEMVERVAEDGKELAQAAKGQFSDQMAVWLLARHLAVFKRLKAEEGGEEGTWKRLREFCDDLVRLRRGDQQSRRLALAEERWERKKAAKGPPRIPMSEEELEEAINEIYGRPKGWRLEQFSQPRNDDKAETFNIQHSTPNIEEVSREEREVGAEVVAEGQQRIGDSQSSSLRGPGGGPAEEGAAEEGVTGQVAGVRDAEDGRAKAVLMGREQVGLPGRVWEGKLMEKGEGAKQKSTTNEHK
jgi:hypothetical protein